MGNQHSHKHGLSHSPSGRVPVDAVRTLGPYGPQLDSWTSTRKSHTAPSRGAPGRSSFKATEIRASFRGKSESSTPVEEPTCKIVPSPSGNLALLAKKELKSKIVASASDHAITVNRSNGLKPDVNIQQIFGTSKQKINKLPEVKICSPEKERINDGKPLKIEEVAGLPPFASNFEGAAPSVTTEVPSPLEEASTPSSSGSTEPASSEKPSTSSSPTSSHKPSGDDETLAASLSDVAQPLSSSTSSPEKQPPPPSPSTYPLAFTIDFNDGKKLDIGDSISKFAPRHIRNLSLSRQEEAKSLKQEKEGKSEMEVKKPSPPALSPTVQPAAVPMLRRAGYHSEGYFSSDQDEDLSIKSDLTALKKNQEKILKPSTLTQDKKSKPVSSLAIESNSPNSRRPLAGERRTISLEESASQHFAKILAEKASIPTKSPEKEVIETLSDNGSETGTYTIDKESPSPDEEKARSDIDAVFGVGEDEARGGYDNRTFTRNKEMKNGHEEHTVLSSSYRAGPNWIKEWAAQVAEQHNTQPLSPPNEPVLPSIKSKGRATSPLRGTKPSPRASPAPPSRNWPPPTEPSASAKARYKLPSLSSPVASDFSDPSESPVHKRNVERPVDNETESYLRTTESVMSAMQARMTSQTLDNADSEEEAGLSSGAVTAKSLTAQLRAKLKALEQKSVRSKHHAAIAAAVAKAPSPPPVAPAPTSAALKRVTGTKSKDERQSDSSSDAGDHKPRSRERSDSVGPHTSLRRARLEADEAKTKALQQPPKPALVKPSPPAAVSKLKKEPPKTVSKPPLSSSNFQRTDGGRFSLRAGKANTQIPSSSAPKGKPPANAAKKEPAKKTNSSGGNRSNSNLCSKELEFQNWKRRKNYDPMKAAAEGKKKAAAAAKPVNPNQGGDIMTQSAIVMTHSSPNASPLNSILRSASFHGTGAMASMNSSHGSNATSEDEATLSADEELAEKSNSSVSPRHLRQFPSSPLRAVSQPPDHLSPRKKSLDETLEGGSSRGFVRNTTPTSSVRSRGKFEALDNLVIAAIHGFSNKIKGSSHNVLGKLRVLFQEDQEKVLMLEDALNLLEESEPATTSPNKSPSKELSGTLRNLKKLEHVFNVLDEVLFGDEDLELRDDDDLSELEEA
ncbi:nucleolar protein dao-5-like isoform X2 [Neocloeon triangulifer]|uniref:nucleolar protein dao-5-like isoform X2 n=1 Tax=Neocloeon triangulifer TaxID=2078957 RepID=UPI00286FADAE|nr:nucleolar protein dao-5-like isoform X2 [Neocloeon triangulifer]